MRTKSWESIMSCVKCGEVMTCVYYYYYFFYRQSCCWASSLSAPSSCFKCYLL